jgi:hypothetical protein
MQMSVADPIVDERSPHDRRLVRHPWLAFARPSVLAVIASLVSLSIAQEWSPGTQFLLLRCIDLLVLMMYFWQFARHSPSLLEASGIFLVSAGFLYLVSKATVIAATIILILALSWFAMTWIAKRWPLLRGLSTLAVFTIILQSALLILRGMKAGAFADIMHHLLSLTFLCLLTFIAYFTSRAWHVGKIYIPGSQIQSTRFWSTLLFLAVFAQTITNNSSLSLSGFHHYGGTITAALTIFVAWKVRLLFGAVRGLRLVPPAMMVMPVNQVILGIYALHPENGFWLAQLHNFNGLCILILSCLITAGIWSRTLGFGLPVRS